MPDLLNFIQNILWTSILVYLFLGAGIYFSIRLRWLQLYQFRHMFSLLKHTPYQASNGLTNVQCLCLSLAGRIGIGNLMGVSIAIITGGPGAIFWMWVTACISMATSFIECVLAQFYKTRDAQGNYHGGPAYYMERGLGMRWMGVIFSLLLIFAFGLIFNTFQVRASAQLNQVAFHLPPMATGLILMLLCAPVIFGGVRTIVRVTRIIVPLMTLAYLLLAGWVIGNNLSQLPQVLQLVITHAFGLQAVTVGTISYSISQALTQGMQRGLFSNEAGLGSAPIAAAAAAPYPAHPVTQGYVQILGVAIDTLVISSATALLLLSSGVLNDTSISLSGSMLIQRALFLSLGSWGAPCLAIIIFLFSFAATIANYVYTENSLVFLQRAPRRLLLFRSLALGMVLLSPLLAHPLMWQLGSIALALMVLINIITLLLLSDNAFKLFKDYNHQRQIGRVPFFDVKKHPTLIAQVTPGIWGKPDNIK